MPYINKKILNLVLDDEKTENKPKIATAPHGPGEADLFGKLLLGKENWFRIPVAPDHLLRERPVILCNFALTLRALKPIEIQFLSALLKFRDVYVWQGQEMVKASPVNSLSEFCEQLLQMKAASSVGVKRSLEFQGLPESHYIILDYGQFNLLGLNSPQLAALK